MKHLALSSCIRYLFAFPQAAVLRFRYAIIHAFIRSPSRAASPLQRLRCICTLRCSRMAVAATCGALPSLWEQESLQTF